MDHDLNKIETIAERVKLYKRNVKKEDRNNNNPTNVTQVFTVNRPIVLVPNEALKSLQGIYPTTKYYNRKKRGIVSKSNQKSVETQTILSVANQSNNGKPRIPRPANAFMLFANENRKKVAKQFPQESNKEISCRLGNQWKSLPPDQKDKYFSMAKAVDAEHKKKYPDYVYNPKEARLRKALRERERSMGGGAGAPGACLPRSRRWTTAPGKMIPPTASPHGMPQHHQPTPEHLMSGPGKDMRSMQNDFSRGFMNMNGGPGSGYFFSGPQYHVNPQSDYPTYIHVTPNGWMPNGYVQNNPMVQQQIWNQYQADRIRAHQAQSSAYLMQPEEPQYTRIEPMQTANSMIHPQPQQMEQSGAKEIISNIENSCSDVSNFLNINTTSGGICATNSSNVEVNTPTNVIDVAAVCDETTPTIVLNNEQSSQQSVTNNTQNTVSGDVQELAGNLNVQTTGNVDGNNDNASSETIDNTTNGFDMQLFEEESLANLNSQDIHKNINSSNSAQNKSENPETSKPTESIPQAHSQSQKPESLPEPLISPYFSVEALQKQSAQGTSSIKPFSNMFDNSFFMEYVTPEFIIPNPEGQPKDDFPIDFSAQKYYETIAGGFEGGFMPGGFLCEDGYTFVPYTNPPEMSGFSNMSFPSDYDYFVQDGGKIEVKNEPENNKNDNNFILDLSKNDESDSNECSAAKFNEVSSRICDELAKII